jgi:gamma-glutamyltranspeptidase / glutathione hydrolase
VGLHLNSLSRDVLIQQGITEIPRFGFVPVTVPGAVKGWATLHQRFGVLPFKEVLSSCHQVARDGFHVTETVSNAWKNAFDIYSKHLKDDAFKALV